MLRVVMLGIDDVYSLHSLEAVGACHHVVAVGTPKKGGGRARIAHAVKPGPFARVAKGLGARIWLLTYRADPRFLSRLRNLNPDLMCIAGFPWVLPREVFEIPRLGTINLHNALLPRHRGPLPLFWIYYNDDRETGVTVHWVEATADAGDIIAQDAFAVERGVSVEVVHRESAVRGAALLASAVSAIEQGAATRIPQDRSAVTQAPFPKRGMVAVDFALWDVERVWHFLSGLVTRFREPLVDDHGDPVRYRSVSGFDRYEHEYPPGTALRTTEGWELCCRGGIVHLSANSAPERPS